jgi:ABC-2 type transport system ATP-binding protein
LGLKVEIQNLNYQIRKDKTVLNDISLDITPGNFVAVLGENGAGKTTLLDLIMGFRKPTQGYLKVQDEKPHQDNWRTRQEIAYLSEKVDIPGDWTAGDFLNFNEYFYTRYDHSLEDKYLKVFRVNRSDRLGNMSAGEIRRVQIVAALSIEPKLIVVDEITAVLDIVGRRHFMRLLKDLNQQTHCTIVLATNILEDLANNVSHVMLLRKGSVRTFEPLPAFLGGASTEKFSQKVADLLEEDL